MARKFSEKDNTELPTAQSPGNMKDKLSKSSWFLRKISSNSMFSTSSLEDDVFPRCSASPERGDWGQSREARVLVLGARGAGKTALVNRFLEDSFSPSHLPTLQQMYQGEVHLGPGSRCKLVVEDTCGSFSQEFPAMANLSLKACDGLILVFSLEDEQSFKEVSQLRLWAESEAPGTATVVVGTKQDLERGDLPYEEIEATVSLDWECGYVECSSLEGTGVPQVFRSLLSLMGTARNSTSTSSLPLLKSKHKTRLNLKKDTSNCQIS